MATLLRKCPVRRSRRAGWLGPSRARLALLFALVLITHGCATSGLQSMMGYKPYRERAETQVQGDLSVTVALPTAAEAQAIYGADLAEKHIQPVWVEVRNDAAVPYWFLISGLDPNYFAASEAAYAFHDTTAADRALDERFESLQFRNPVMPGATVSGFVLTNLDEGVKVVDVDLIARGNARTFTFIVVDPSFKATSLRVDFDKLYRSDELIHVDDEDELRTLLEQLPCCVTNFDGTENADPLNLVLVGDRADFLAALVRRQWHPTEIISPGSLWRTVSAFIQGSRYRYSPFSALYLYDRPQDIAAQKTRGSIHERNHARFWLSPIRFRGKEVYVGQISRDIGVKFTLKSPTISTHVIDPDIDESRRYLVEDLLYSQALHRIGFVKGVGASSKAEPQLNLMGDPYYTDGLRAVMFFEPRPNSLSQLEVLDWERVPSASHTLQQVSVSEQEERR
jgi:LssY C-terminus